MAMFLTMFDCELVDTSGQTVHELPQPRRDNLYVTSSNFVAHGLDEKDLSQLSIASD